MAEKRYVDVGGRKTQVTVGGSGPAVVFLHSALSECDWADWCDALADNFTLYLPAHPGFAESQGYEQITDVEDVAFHYDDLFAELDLNRPALIGQSLGGWIAAEYAVRWPEKVRGLVLVDAAGVRSDEAAMVDMWATRPPELADLMFADATHPLYQMMKLFDPENPPPAEVIVPFYEAMQATARLGWNPYLHDPRLPGRLHRVTCPTLVVWGERDGLIPPEHGRRYAELIAGASLATIPDCGHLPLVERPDQAVAIVGEFLRRLD